MEGGSHFLPIAGKEHELAIVAHRWLEKNEHHIGKHMVKSFLAFVEKWKPADVENVLREALDTQTTPSAAAIDLLDILELQGKFDDMLPIADRLIVLWPQEWSAWERKIRALKAQGQFQKATEVCNEALRAITNPNHSIRLRMERCIVMTHMARNTSDQDKRLLFSSQAIADAEYAWEYGMFLPEMVSAWMISLMTIGRLHDACTIGLRFTNFQNIPVEVIYHCAIALESAGRSGEILNVPRYTDLLTSPLYESSWFAIADAWARSQNDLVKGAQSYRAIFDLIDSGHSSQSQGLPSITALRENGLIEMQLIANELRLAEEALVVLDSRPPEYHSILTFWLVRAVLSGQIDRFTETEASLKKLFGGKTALDVLNYLKQKTNSGIEYSDEDALLSTSLETAALCELLTGHYERAIELEEGRLRQLPDKSEGLVSNTSFHIVCRSPPGTPITTALASLVLRLCVRLGTLDDTAIQAVRDGMDGLDFKDAIEHCERDPVIAAALGAILMRSELLTMSGAGLLVANFKVIKAALMSQSAQNHADALVRRIATAICAE